MPPVHIPPSNPTDHHCDRCLYWGGWAPVQVGQEIRLDVHGICKKPQMPKTIADPNVGCAFWMADRRMTARIPITPFGDG